MNIKKLLTTNLELLFYLVLSVFSVLPFFAGGFFSFHDDVQVSRIYEMAKSLSSWQFPVRWVQDLGYGLGYPIFNFYSVLPYYIGGFITILGVDVLISTKIVFGFAIIASGLSMFFLVKPFFGKIGALVAAVIYLYFPYHAVNIYVRGDLAELAAYAFLPLVFLALFKVHLSSQISILYILLGSVSIAAVILSHNLTFFMLFIFITIFVAYSVLFKKKRGEHVISYVLILSLAFLLSAFYAVPAVLEAKNTNIMSIIGGGSDFRDHFVCAAQLWDSPWGFGGSAYGCVDGMSFKLGKLNIILAVLAALFAMLEFKKLKERKFLVLISTSFLVLSIFMTLEYSSPLWNLPFMNFLQFPWRYLNFVGLFVSVLIGYLIWQMKELFGDRTSIIFIITIIFITIIVNAKLFVPQKILNRDSSYYTNPFYLSWTASKISDEYLPKGFVKPKNPTELQNLATKQGNVKNIRQTPIQLASNALSIIGVVGAALVIIGRPRIKHPAG